MLLNFGIETLGDIVEIGTGKFSANTSLVYNGRSFSFGEQRSRIYRLANVLYEMGVRRQHRVAILAQNSNAYVEVYAAGEVSGFITVAINFIILAFIIFVMVRQINRLKHAAPPPPPPATPEDVVLLREIRDALKR